MGRAGGPDLDLPSPGPVCDSAGVQSPLSQKNVTYGNPAALGRLGLVDDDLRRMIGIVSAITPGDRPRANETCQRVLGRGIDRI